MNVVYKALLATTLLLMSSSVFAHGEKGQIGAGIGHNYGVIGVGFDLNITDNMALASGLGVLFDKASYSIGAKYYLRDNNVLWRPRITALYGTTYIIEKSSYGNETYEHFQGISIGIGQSFAFGSKRKHGFDLDLFYRVTDGGAEDRLQALENQGYYSLSSYHSIAISLGYRHSF